MTEKEAGKMTLEEAGKRGGKARAEKYSREQLREWARKGGWPKGRPRKRRDAETPNESAHVSGET